jgi:hypothetical protein
MKLIVDLDRLVVVNPKEIPTWDTDLEAHAESYAARLRAEEQAVVNMLGHLASITAMAEAVWRLQGRPEDDIQERTHRWYGVALNQIAAITLAAVPPAGQG